MTPLEELRKQIESLPLPLDNPHLLSESAVKMAILLSEFVDPLAQLESAYLESRGDTYARAIGTGIKPTPAKEMSDMYSAGEKLKVEHYRNYIKAKENVIFRIEKHLDTKIKLESRQI